jgi:hypothetical protein
VRFFATEQLEENNFTRHATNTPPAMPRLSASPIPTKEAPCPSEEIPVPEFSKFANMMMQNPFETAVPGSNSSAGRPGRDEFGMAGSGEMDAFAQNEPLSAQKHPCGSRHHTLTVRAVCFVISKLLMKKFSPCEIL